MIEDFKITYYFIIDKMSLKNPLRTFFSEKSRPHLRSALLWEYKYSVVASNAPFRVAPL